MSAGTWLDADVGALATNKILDAAETLFAERGGAKVNMAEIANAAGCSRATLYRYFDSRDALCTAYVHREARRVGALVATDVAAMDKPHVVTTELIMSAVRRVRARPLLHAWFSFDRAGAGPAVAQTSAIASMVAAYFGDPTDPDVLRRARWVVRVIVSLLTIPAASATEERTLIEQFVTPVIGP